ncbi:MAG: sulfurtransferase complex subunit TusB [Proteobacteria bacterium]|jgi:tRNA 2-thiouridine synthesizing protein B|nr:sulfurtransferase complex subunit TusB [Pseudomonadota bacterium]MCG6934312.1 sulfurtransferase complex subunit TusB [Pseudomonadota bacterium]
MSTLHTVNKSPFDRRALESCLRLATKGSAVLLFEDGVYGAMKGTEKSAIVEKALGDVSIYVLGADMKARGVDTSKLIDGIKVVDYKGFVDLTVENDKVNAWL